MRDEQGRSEITVGDGGWLRVQVEKTGVLAFLRFDLAPDGRLYPAEMNVQAHGDLHAPVASGGRALLGFDLRTFPLSAIEAAANSHLRDKILAKIHRTTAAVYRKADGAIRKAPVTSRRLTQTSDTGDADDRAALQLDVPTTRPFPDEFYAQVAAAYTYASRTRRPAALIAERNAVPVKTVHRWVAEARRRGHLAPGRKGKVG